MQRHSIEYVERHYKDFLAQQKPMITQMNAGLIIMAALAFGALAACCYGVAA